jgi:hypothetical protein
VNSLRSVDEKVAVVAPANSSISCVSTFLGHSDLFNGIVQVKSLCPWRSCVVCFCCRCCRIERIAACVAAQSCRHPTTTTTHDGICSFVRRIFFCCRSQRGDSSVVTSSSSVSLPRYFPLARCHYSLPTDHLLYGAPGDLTSNKLLHRFLFTSRRQTVASITRTTMDEYSKNHSNIHDGIIPPNKVVGDQQTVAGRLLQLLGSHHRHGDGGSSTTRILPDPLSNSFSRASTDTTTSSSNDRILPPFALPFLSSMMMHPPSLNVLGSSIPLLSSLPASGEGSTNTTPRRFMSQQQQPTPNNHRLDDANKAELYEVIREQARVQALVEAAQLFNSSPSSAPAPGAGGGRASSSQGMPMLLQNIRDLIHNNSNNNSNIIKSDSCSDSHPGAAAAACYNLLAAHQGPVVPEKPSVHSHHHEPVSKKKRIGVGIVVLPLQDKDRKATFPLPASSVSSSSTRSVRGAAAACYPPTAVPKLHSTSLAETWKQLEQRVADRNKPPIPMPHHAFVRECFVRSLHSGQRGSSSSFLKRRLEEKVQGILQSNQHQHHQPRSDIAAAASSASAAASSSTRSPVETHHHHHRGGGGIVRLSSDASQASDGSASNEPLKKRLKRNYAATVSNRAEL